MYNPPDFAQDDLSILHDAIETAGLGILVTMGPEGPEASHVPMLLDRADGARGTLSGHLARANPQGRRFDPKVPALAIFQGPDAYVSPSWYPTKAATGKVVPTWNYVAIHAYGGLETFEDAARLRRLVERLTDRHEAGRPAPWAVSDAPEDYIEAMLKGIVGFRLPIDRLEGKWKLSQNKNPADRAGVAAGLAAEGGADQTALVALMKQPR
jgi:transcriptional regulator